MEKWIALAAAVVFAAMFASIAVESVAKEQGKTQRYSACVRHHSPSECARWPE